MKTLYLITARGGSKGIPGKNIKPLAGKPLNHYYQEVDGLLQPFGPVYTRRQDAPVLYKHNGSIYIINVNALMQYKSFGQFNKVRKYVMSEDYSLDIDTMDDWKRLEYLILNVKNELK